MADHAPADIEAIAEVMIARRGVLPDSMAADDCRRDAAALLASPALATLRAQAWDQGYTSGHSNAMRRMSDEPNAPTTPNPHRDRADRQEPQSRRPSNPVGTDIDIETGKRFTDE